MCKANRELLQYPGAVQALSKSVEFTGKFHLEKKSPRKNAAKSHRMSVKGVNMWDSLNDELKCFSSVAKLNK